MLAKARQLGWSDRLVLLDALASLALASALIRLAPFERAVRSASRRRPGTPRASDATVRRVVWSVDAAAARVPWKAMCFQRGLAVQRMLRRRGLDAFLHYGLGHGGARDLEAHVWVTVGGVVVIGGEEARRFHQVAVFPDWGPTVARSK
ncbi:lasso peptide biosynthesis B2 protein [Sphingomonas sp.]|uniref:lasso peptide biosynthesis B2 protein n=1 Tax=Sphingomonas sp. TaxID=28214 RepID=UPI0025DEF392|nr:lasso peptide biosynthesis B2 protein [Sphingomonas sp.]